MCFSKLFGTVEIPSPSDIMLDTGIVADNYACKVIIDLRQTNIPFVKQPRIWIPPIPDTNSMDPVFDYGHSNILIDGQDEADHRIMLEFLKVGDIAVYDNESGQSIIHRIVEIGYDPQRFFRFKGDNNGSKDPGKIRDSQIKWLYVATIC